MSQITLEDLQERLAALEKTVADYLQKESKPTRFKDWRRAVGLFPDDQLMKEIDEAGRQVREADRHDAGGA